MRATPLPASTVVLLRDGTEGIEVLLLVRRARGSDPFSGASVFPGGVVDPADEDPRLAPPGSGFDAERAARELGEEIALPLRRALYVAACRELLEEAAILLARDAGGAPPSAGA
ncbi:MAG: NUDIX domain-containing protein, partial [Candidatus Binatia bacterium]